MLVWLSGDSSVVAESRGRCDDGDGKRDYTSRDCSGAKSQGGGLVLDAPIPMAGDQIREERSASTATAILNESNIVQMIDKVWN